MTVGIQGRSDRAASEVISVVLMVAVTIVLAAMVGTVLMNVVTDVDESPLAGATTDFDSERDRILVTFTAAEDPDVEVDVTVTNQTSGTEVATSHLAEVGDTATFDAVVDDGHRYAVQVVAVRGDERAVVLQTEGAV